MARVSTGSIVADIAGKVGDEIYSRNRHGPYVKAYAVPVQPDTASQIAARAGMTNTIREWSELSDVEYTAYVAFAEQFSKSGFNVPRKKVDPRSFFFQNALNRQRVSETAKPLPVMPINIGFTDIELDFSDGIHMYATWHGGVNNSDYYMSVYSTTPKSLGVHSINSVQKVYFHKFTYQSDTQKDLWPNYFAVFGGLFPTNLHRTFMYTRIIHVSSGICVGTGWNSSIGIDDSNPFLLGYDTIGVLTASGPNRRGIPVTPISDGFINSITFYHNNVSGNAMVGVYDDDSFSPDSRLAFVSSFSINSGAGWQTVPLGTSRLVNCSVFPRWS